jgi:hypothetical protein
MLMGGFGRYAGMYPFGSNSSLVANAPPNPAAKPAQPQPGMATAQGALAALSKVSACLPSSFEWLSRSVDDTLTRIKSADGAPGHTSALGQTSTEANNTWSSVPEGGIGNRKAQIPSRMQGGHQSALGGQRG